MICYILYIIYYILFIIYYILYIIYAILYIYIYILYVLNVINYILYYLLYFMFLLYIYGIYANHRGNHSNLLPPSLCSFSDHLSSACEAPGWKPGIVLEPFETLGWALDLPGLLGIFDTMVMPNPLMVVTWNPRKNGMLTTYQTGAGFRNHPQYLQRFYKDYWVMCQFLTSLNITGVQSRHNWPPVWKYPGQ